MSSQPPFQWLARLCRLAVVAVVAIVGVVVIVVVAVSYPPIAEAVILNSLKSASLLPHLLTSSCADPTYSDCAVVSDKTLSFVLKIRFNSSLRLLLAK
jgi:hypothetical protein